MARSSSTTDRRKHSTDKKLAAVHRHIFGKEKISDLARDQEITRGMMSKWIEKHEKEVRKIERERKANGANGVSHALPLNGSSHGTNGSTPPGPAMNGKAPSGPVTNREALRRTVAKAVARMRAGESAAAIAKELGKTTALMYQWSAKVKKNPSHYVLALDDDAAASTAAAPSEGEGDSSALAELTKRYKRLRDATEDAVAWLKLGEKDIDERRAARRLHGTDYAHAMLVAARAELERAV